MASPILTLFNPRGGSGKTFLTYHLAWMFAELGLRVLAVDLNPDADLTMAFLGEERLFELWMGEQTSVTELFEALGLDAPEIPLPGIEEVGEGVGLLPATPDLQLWEDEFVRGWAHSGSFSANLSRLLQAAAEAHSADLVLLDLASNLGAVTHTALRATDFLVLPLRGDVFSVHSLISAASILRSWRQQLAGDPSTEKRMEPAGYIVLQDLHFNLQVGETNSLPVLQRIYYESLLGTATEASPPGEDPLCLGILPDFQGLVSMAQEARKPIFYLKPADGAGGSHLKAAHMAHGLFKQLARRLAGRVGVEIRN
jgi:chromosome partitioning protein